MFDIFLREIPMKEITCFSAVQPSDFYILPIISDQISEDFLRQMQEGKPYRFKMNEVKGVENTRNALRVLSESVGGDFVVFGIEDKNLYWDSTAAIVKVPLGSYHSVIKKDVYSLCATMAEGEQATIRYPYRDMDVLSNICASINDYASESRTRFAWVATGTARSIIIERFQQGQRQHSALTKTLSELAQRKQQGREGSAKPYHDIIVGDACEIPYDGSKPKEMSIRTTVSAYARRSGKRFKVSKGDGCMIVTRSE